MARMPYGILLLRVYDLDEVRHIDRHFLDRGVVKRLDLAHLAHVVERDKVDGHTLAAETARATNAVNVVFAVRGEVVVDNERDLLHVNTASEQVRGDENTRRARAEFLHDEIALLLIHVAVQARNRKVTLAHVLGEPVHLSALIHVDDRLRDCQCRVEIAQSIELKIFLLDGNVELLDTFKRQLVLLHENAYRVPHKPLRHLKHVRRHCRREKPDLARAWHVLEHVVNLLLEPARKHLISLIEHKSCDVRRVERATVDEIKDAPGRAYHDVRRVCLEDAHVFRYACAANARVAFERHVVAKRHHHLLDLLRQLARRRQDHGLHARFGRVDVLQRPDHKSRRLAHTRLRLRDGIASGNKRGDRALLNR
mmetsp:Transcript_1761/g.4675  ORF Transcript_1761/g.4675 Transcript_1761/m.4675 type:complete len:367 (-) Transcript_1761:266-1366(-)